LGARADNQGALKSLKKHKMLENYNKDDEVEEEEDDIDGTIKGTK
jgi:hypothetical protein